MAWSPGTGGVVSGTPVIAPLKERSRLDEREEAVDEFIEEHRGKLGGEIVLIRDLETVEVSDQPLLKRFSEADLQRRAKAPIPVEPVDFDDPELEIPDDPHGSEVASPQGPCKREGVARRGPLLRFENTFGGERRSREGADSPLAAPCRVRRASDPARPVSPVRPAAPAPRAAWRPPPRAPRGWRAPRRPPRRGRSRRTSGCSAGP